MKPTAGTLRNASAAVSAGAGRPRARRRWALATVLVLGGLATFLLGRMTAPGTQDLISEIEYLRLAVQQQQGAVDRLAAENRRGVNALAARLAELQASSTRLDALGERLAQMGQLSLDEFDFTAPAPVGGPEELETLGEAREDELRSAIDALSDKLRRQASQLDALQFLMVNRQLESDLTPTGRPLRKGYISSHYGERTDPFSGKRAHHSGLDFVGPRGSDVLSVASGVVIRASLQPGYGNLVEIDHGNGYRTRYAHNEKIVVKPGDHVTAGQVIATLGATGRASAPHVHFEVLKDGRTVNPAKFVSALR